MGPQIREPVAATKEVLQVVSVTYPCQGDWLRALVYNMLHRGYPIPY